MSEAQTRSVPLPFAGIERLIDTAGMKIVRAVGKVPVAAPVAIGPDGASASATADFAAMDGLAGRIDYRQEVYEDGETFPLLTEGRCLIQLVGPMDVPLLRGAGFRTYRLHPSDAHHVTMLGGKIVDVAGERFHV